MLVSGSGLLLLLLSYVGGEMLILVSTQRLPSGSGVTPSAAEGQFGRQLPACPLGHKLVGFKSV